MVRRGSCVSPAGVSPVSEASKRRVAGTKPGWPQLEHILVKECLPFVLNQEWEHRLYAERDLTVLKKED